MEIIEDTQDSASKVYIEHFYERIINRIKIREKRAIKKI